MTIHGPAALFVVIGLIIGCLALMALVVEALDELLRGWIRERTGRCRYCGWDVCRCFDLGQDGVGQEDCIHSCGQHPEERRPPCHGSTSSSDGCTTPTEIGGAERKEVEHRGAPIKPSSAVAGAWETSCSCGWEAMCYSPEVAANGIAEHLIGLW